jgi:CRISPR-associated protein Csc1
MHIYRGMLELKEATFFASREVNALFQTDAVIGNYALTYALGLCQAPYRTDGGPRYQEDLSALAEQGVYVTPGSLLEPFRYVFAQFNGLSEGYFSAMANNALAVPGTGQWAERDGQHWYIRGEDNSRRRVSPANFPQIGRIRMLAAENWARFHVFSEQPLNLPAYIRLGKFMSKAKVTVEEVRWQRTEGNEETIRDYLNPTDLSHETNLRIYDVLSVRPAPLIRNAALTGPLYRIEAKTPYHLPAEMRYLARL